MNKKLLFIPLAITLGVAAGLAYHFHSVNNEEEDEEDDDLYYKKKVKKKK